MNSTRFSAAVWIALSPLPLWSADSDDAIDMSVQTILALRPKAVLNGEELRKLDRERFHASLSALEERYKGFVSGRELLEVIAESAERVCTAGMDALEDRKDKIALLESYVTLSRAVEKLQIARLDAGKVGTAEKFEAQYTRDGGSTSGSI